MAAFFTVGCTSEDPNYTSSGSYLMENQSFSILLPGDFEVTSFSGEDSKIPAHLTAVKDQNLITISKASYFRLLDESCSLAANNFVHDRKEITSGPEVRGGVCRISATTNGIKSELFMMRDDTSGILYSITYKGDLNMLHRLVEKHLDGDNYLNVLKYQD